MPRGLPRPGRADWLHAVKANMLLFLLMIKGCGRGHEEASFRGCES